ncbi:MAG: DivIVA domain-containing protein [Nitriliruptorales bacterium]
MTAWIVVGLACVLGLVVTLIALFAEDRSQDLVGSEPEWLLPAPNEVRSIRFPRAWRGYHPASVDVFLAALTASYETLYDRAGPDVVAEAREHLARRLPGQDGRDTDELSKGSGEQVR